MHGNVSGLTELGIPNCQHAVDQVHIVAIETQCFVGPQATGRVQSKERGKGVAPQTDCGRQLPRRLE